MTNGTLSSQNLQRSPPIIHETTKRVRTNAPPGSILGSLVNDSAVFGAVAEQLSPSAVLKREVTFTMSTHLPRLNPVIRTSLWSFIGKLCEAYYKKLKSEQLQTSTKIVTSVRMNFMLNFNSNVENGEGASLLTNEKDEIVESAQIEVNSFATRVFELNHADHKCATIRVYCRLLHDTVWGVIAILHIEFHAPHQAVLDFLALNINASLVILKCTAKMLLDDY